MSRDLHNDILFIWLKGHLK